MRENQTWIQNEILAVLNRTPLDSDHVERFTAVWLSQKLNYSRNFISQLLNDLVAQRQCVKINTRPVYYLSRQQLLSLGYEIPDAISVISGWPDLKKYKNRKEADVFDSLIGKNGSRLTRLSKPRPRLPIPRRACRCF